MEVENLAARLQRTENFLSQDPANLSLFHDCFEICLQLGDYDKAQQLVDEALQRHVNEPSINFNQSKIYLANGQFVEALVPLHSLQKQGINNPGIIYNIAWAKLNLGQYESLIDDVEEFSEFVPEYPPLLIIKARALHLLQKFQEAVDALNLYIDLDASNAEAFGLKALLLLDLGQYSEAKKIAKKTLELYPYNHEALITLSTIALNEQEPDQALTYLSTKQDLTAQSGRMMLNLGQAHMLNMQFDDAELALNEAASLMSSHIGTWHALAWVEIVLDKIDDAKRCFERAMELDRNFSESHGGLAVIAVFQNDFKLAEKYTKVAIRLDPMSASGRYAESLLLDKGGNAEVAKAQIIELMTSAKGVDGSPITQMIAKASQRLNLTPNKNTIQ